MSTPNVQSKDSEYDPHERGICKNYTLGRIFIGDDENSKFIGLILMCQYKCCLQLVFEDVDCNIYFGTKDEKGGFNCDMKKFFNELMNEREAHLSEKEAEEIVDEVEDQLKFIASLPPVQVKPLRMTIEELREMKKKVEVDPMVYEILKLLCFSKTTLTTSMLGRRLHIAKRTVINKTKVLKELKLVESKERHKGYTATKEAFRLVQV